MRTDQDVLNIAANYGICYTWAKVLKALQFGIVVPDGILMWCGDSSNCLGLNNIIYRIQRRIPAIRIERVKNDGYVITEAFSLNSVRSAMATRRDPPPKPVIVDVPTFERAAMGEFV
jgi:hypothetical protein